MTMNVDQLLSRLDETPAVSSKGRIKEVVGLIARARIPEVFVGELCEIRNPRSNTTVSMPAALARSAMSLPTALDWAVLSPSEPTVRESAAARVVPWTSSISCT